jgi:hypothetical protein
MFGDVSESQNRCDGFAKSPWEPISDGFRRRLANACVHMHELTCSHTGTPGGAHSFKDVVSEFNEEKRGEVNTVVNSLQVLIGARGVKFAFNTVFSLSCDTLGGIVFQCCSRLRGVKFAAEFVTYTSISTAGPWITDPFEAPASLVMTVSVLQDLA